MVTFAIICLLIIIIASTHVINWVWREMWKQNIISAIIILQFLQILLIAGCVINIIKWGQILIK